MKSTIALFLTASATVSAKDSRSQKRELEKLLSVVMPFAEQMLKTHGEFYPFGATLDNEGKISHAGGYTGTEHPNSTEVIDLLKVSFRREAETGKIAACALVYNIRTIPPGKTQKIDAIAIDLDHRDGMTTLVVYPYTIAVDKSVTLSEPYAVKGKGEIFRSNKNGEPSAAPKEAQPHR